MDYNVDRHDKLHLWVGTNFMPKAGYEEYFKLDHTTEGDFYDPTYKVPGFCQDIGAKWYDEDFIGIVSQRSQEVEVEKILVDAGLEATEFTRAKKACADLGIYKANAIFWYADSELVLATPLRSSYNGLCYIGLYEGG